MPERYLDNRVQHYTDADVDPRSAEPYRSNGFSTKLDTEILDQPT
ncbi:hypothetical protein OHB12_14005 [Nocardia sp. NBC_01730]|nr:hypothetical protein OHB12_14005 [Nocardia sp. NBC_01730]